MDIARKDQERVLSTQSAYRKWILPWPDAVYCIKTATDQMTRTLLYISTNRLKLESIYRYQSNVAFNSFIQFFIAHMAPFVHYLHSENQQNRTEVLFHPSGKSPCYGALHKIITYNRMKMIINKYNLLWQIFYLVPL